jgi:hypothetical protein
MPSKTDKQRKFMELVYAYKIGKVDEKDVDRKIKQAAEDMTFVQLLEFLKESKISKLVTLLESKIGKKVLLEIKETEGQRKLELAQLQNPSHEEIYNWLINTYVYKNNKGLYSINFMSVPLAAESKQLLFKKFKIVFSPAGQAADKWKKLLAIWNYFVKNRELDDSNMWYIHPPKSQKGKKILKNRLKDDLLKSFIDLQINESFFSPGLAKEEQDEIKSKVADIELVLKYFDAAKEIRRDSLIGLTNKHIKAKRDETLYTRSFIKDFLSDYERRNLEDFETVLNRAKKGFEKKKTDIEKKEETVNTLTGRDFKLDWGEKQPYYNFNVEEVNPNKIKKVIDQINYLRKILKKDIAFSDHKASPGDYVNILQGTRKQFGSADVDIDKAIKNAVNVINDGYNKSIVVKPLKG